MLRRPYFFFTTALITLHILLGQPNGVAADVPFPAAQPCFDAATAAAKCDDSSTASFNPCACSNTGGWLDMSAKCIGATDGSQLTDIYNTLATNCAGSSTPIAYGLDTWLAMAGSSTSTSSTTSTTSLSTPGTTKVSTTGQTVGATSLVTRTQSGSTSVATLGAGQSTGSSSSKASGGGSGTRLNTPSIVGIAVGIPCFLALMALLGTLFYIRRQKQDDSHSPGSKMDYDAPDYGAPQGAAAASKSPQSTATVMSNTAPQSSYEHYSYPATQPTDPMSQSNMRTGPYPQPAFVPQQMQGMRPMHSQNPRFYPSDPRSGTVEMQAPTARPHELGGYI